MFWSDRRVFRANLTLTAAMQRFMAFDLGSRRTGVATGNRLLPQATPQPTLRAEGAAARLQAVAARLAEWQPDALVVGVPRHPDGAPHEMTAQALRFARQLRGRALPAEVQQPQRMVLWVVHNRGVTIGRWQK